MILSEVEQPAEPATRCSFHPYKVVHKSAGKAGQHLVQQATPHAKHLTAAPGLLFGGKPVSAAKGSCRAAFDSSLPVLAMGRAGEAATDR